MFWKPALFLFSGREAPNLVEPYTALFSTTGHQRNGNMLRNASKNKSSPRVLTGKWLLKNYELTTSLKNKIRTNPQIKNHEKSHGLSVTRLQTQNKKPEHTHFKILTPLTPFVEKTVNLYGFK